MTGSLKCKPPASVTLAHASIYRKINQNCQRQPGSQADPATCHTTHHHAQGKDISPGNRRAPQTGHSPHRKVATRDVQNHHHQGELSKNNGVKPGNSSPQANATATPHFLL
ncbi:hypothetical protein AMECASPLE_037371 [Ameca splendens]|uniref:Uncharacterized protein n=1 Tax=Ameca splendens TaxID=208324 RepID=A0ABV0Z5T0_9TELE